MLAALARQRFFRDDERLHAHEAQRHLHIAPALDVGLRRHAGAHARGVVLVNVRAELKLLRLPEHDARVGARSEHRHRRCEFTRARVHLQDAPVARRTDREQIELHLRAVEHRLRAPDARLHARKLRLGRLRGEELALLLVLARDFGCDELRHAIPLVALVRERHLGLGELLLQRGKIRLLRGHERGRIARVLLHQHIARLHLVADFHMHLRDERSHGGRDAHVLVHALDEPASTDGFCKRRARWLVQRDGRGDRLPRIEHKPEAGERADDGGKNEEPEDEAFHGKIWARFRRIVPCTRRNYGCLSPRRPPFPRCDPRMKKYGCRA